MTTTAVLPPVDTTIATIDVATIDQRVRDRQDEIAASRRLPASVVDAMRASGLYRMVLPAELGGVELPLGAVVDAVAAIAAADGSAGWCAAIGAGSNVFAGYLPRHAAEQVFADPDQANATMFAPSGAVEVQHGRARLDGRWAFTSNCLHSSWAGVGAMVRRDGDSEPGSRLVFVALDDPEIEDTWSSPGLRGTGSHHVTATDVTVDLERSCRFDDAAWPAGTMWRLPIYTVLGPVLAAVPLGIARGAVDDVLALARDGRDARRGNLHDDVVAMAELSVADTDLRAITALLHHEVAVAHDCVERGDTPDRRSQARILLAAMHAGDVAVRATSVAHALGGAAAVYDGNRLLRALLDVQTARQHLVFSHQHRAPLIAVVAGRDVSYPPFLA
jgi:alkylation response protein AidB-like acyl-CoA dehydrogenase